jgi:ferredoxin--NADP+ reductase
VAALIDDMVVGRLPHPQFGDGEALATLVHERRPEVVDRKGWLAIDAEERSRGRERGRPRVKFTEIDDMVDTARAAMYTAK